MRLRRAYTLRTSSDHRAVIGVYVIGGRRLRVGFLNVGDGPNKRKRRDLRRLTRRCDIVVLAEVGDRDLDKLLSDGWGHRKHARVALCWRLDLPPTVLVDDQLLSERQDAGPGRGPRIVGEKQLVGARWDIGDETLSLGGLHLAASQNEPGRRKLATEQVHQALVWVDRQPGHVLLVGDWNNTPGSPVLAPIRAAGFEVAPTGPTHRTGRQIDQQWRRAHTEETEPMTGPTITQRVVARAEALGADVYTHDEWGSLRKDVYAARRRLRPVRILKADTLWAHITVTFDSGDLVGDFFRDMRTVERIGYERFGSGFSYNAGIDNDKGRIGVGQPLDAKGTHTVNDKGTPGFSYDQNHAGRAWAFIGMPGDKLSPEARHAAVIWMAAQILEGALTEDPDHVPHSLVAAKDCPTDTVRDELPGIKRDALALVAQVRAGRVKPKSRRWKFARQQIKAWAIARDRARDAGQDNRLAKILATLKHLRESYPKRVAK